MKKIRTIEAAVLEEKKLRVCAYCRVSSDQAEQKNSFSAQVEHYTTYIKNNPAWNFAGIYADEALSGKNAAKRPEFMRMVMDAEKKKFDLIITKSISRFARNTSDCLETVRRLKLLGIAVQFEKEAINTLNAESELMLSILSSIAEEELVSISQNMRWGYQRRFKNGQLKINTKRFLGYDKDKNGKLIINEEQASTVRCIFKDYLSGMGISRIAKGLDAQNISGNVKWASSTIRDILKNEKYIGDMLLQKTITTDFKKKRNKGEVPMYYVKDSHPAIINREDFEKAQELMVERAKSKGNVEGNRDKYLKRYAFTSNIECGHCGNTYKRHLDNCGNVAESACWICSTYIMEGKNSCSMGRVKEETIKGLFVRVFNRLYTDRVRLLADYKARLEREKFTEFDHERIEKLDEGISGTNTKKRVEFNRMIEDCMAGKIDMVITKSISRFARNTLDTLQYVRQLKEKGIAIFFEKENVNTLDSKGEFLITLLGSLAQEESNSLSQATRMGIVFKFQEGKVKVNHNKFLGYTKDENGELVIVQEEAEVVRRIYREFLEGKSGARIATDLERDGILTGAGKEKWPPSTVTKILKNEKYMGDALLQKTYTVDFLTKKRVKNTGIVQQYYVEDSHPAIVNKEEFAAVQAEFVKRSSMRGYSKTGKSAYTSEYPFSGKLFCQNCGSKFRRQAWGKGKNKKYVWRCINREHNGVDSCSTKPIKEKDLEQAFLRVINTVIGAKEAFMQNIDKGLEQEYTMEQIDSHLTELQQELMNMVRFKFEEKEHSTLAGEIELMRGHRQKLKEEEAWRVLRDSRINEIKVYLVAQGLPLDKFDGDLFRRLIEKIKVQSMVEVVFVFKTGVEVSEILG